MNEKIKKFENPERLAELDPKNTLIKLGFNENMVLCDIGAGSGIFSLPAAQLSSGDIYALEIPDGMIDAMESKKAESNLRNLLIRKVESDSLPLQSGICDMVIMVTVFHEIEDKTSMLKEINRILKENGKLAMIEFHKEKTPMGPPVDHRISQDQAAEMCNENGFISTDNFKLGDNFYCCAFQSIS